jgi:hypothetical protein
MQWLRRPHPKKAKRKSAGKRSKGTERKTGPAAVASTSARTVVAQNLINMAVVAMGSGTVLLGLMAARHF